MIKVDNIAYTGDVAFMTFIEGEVGSAAYVTVLEPNEVSCTAWIEYIWCSGTYVGTASEMKWIYRAAVAYKILRRDPRDSVSYDTNDLEFRLGKPRARVSVAEQTLFKRLFPAVDRKALEKLWTSDDARVIVTLLAFGLTPTAELLRIDLDTLIGAASLAITDNASLADLLVGL